MKIYKIMFSIACILIIILIPSRETRHISKIYIVQNQIDFVYTQNIPNLDDNNKEKKIDDNNVNDNDNDKVEELNVENNQNQTFSRSSDERKISEYSKFIATAYCGCNKCSEEYGNLTASGSIAKANHTIAMNSSYPFGTKVEIQGYGTYIVEDRGGAIKGNRIDIYFDSHDEALSFGKQTVYIKIISDEKEVM